MNAFRVIDKSNMKKGIVRIEFWISPNYREKEGSIAALTALIEELTGSKNVQDKDITSKH